MAFATPFSPPLGEGLPPCHPHAISESMPTWYSVVNGALRQASKTEPRKSGYPRFSIHKFIRELVNCVRGRLQGIDSSIGCMIFPSASCADRFSKELVRKQSDNIHTRVVTFELQNATASEEAIWTTFCAVLYPLDVQPQAMGFWRDTGTGISSRHAEYCLKRFDYLKSDADLPSLRSPALKERIKDPNLILTAVTTATAERLDIEMLIAKLASSDKPGQRPVTSNDVFLYPNGMAAIYAVIRAIEALDSEGGVAIYGWLYSESLKLIKRGAWSNLLYYGWGSKKELDELEGTLAGGTHIKALLCELPGNPLLNSVDLHRLRALADKYHFLIVCDETVGTFVNTDLLPYVDLLVTSLTKMFSGGCDVMGGSVVVNPQSIDRDAIHGKLKEQYEDTYFPGDIGTMQYNSIDFVQRVYRSNKSAVSIAQLLANHSSVKELHYPLFGPTVHLYERYRRLNGGYGHLMSIVFHKPQSAECFYDALNVCKGSSFGTNFTLAIPYVQLAHFHEQDWAESYGVAKHIIRLSVGLEKQDLLMKVMLQALTAVEILEQSSRGGENPKM